MSSQRLVDEPENRETPLEELRSWVTPNRLFFVRTHFETQHLDRDDWRLEVGGLVENELVLDWPTVAALPTRSVFATMECAGNGRSFLEQPTDGVQWGSGAVGHAEWVGVPVRDVLEQAGLGAGAREIVFRGADRGSEPDHPEPMPFARSLPLEKALHEDTLLAYEMNGDPLTPEHGYPLRLIVPGWYGVASVKWLERVEVIDEEFQGYYQTVKYTVDRRTGRGVRTEVVGEMQPKSEILRPRVGEQCGLGLTTIVGVAWAGTDAVEAVEVSVDGGRTWTLAELTGVSAPYSWTLWRYPWRPSAPGRCELLSRTVSAGGSIQPARHDPLSGGYLIHHSRPLEVEVSAEWAAENVDLSSGAARSALTEAAEERSRLKLDVEMQLADGAGI